MRIALLCLAALTACNRLPEQPLAESGYTGTLRGAMQHLRDSFNSGECGLIHLEASEEFRQLASSQEWNQTCEALRAGLGSWTAFTFRSVSLWQGFHARVEGTGEFNRGSYRLHVSWRLADGRARLFSFRLQGADQNVVVPEPHRNPEVNPPLWRRERELRAAL